MKRLALLVLSSALASACVTTRAASRPVERPALEVPPAPPRVVEPAPVEPATEAEPVNDVPPPPVSAPPPKPRNTASKDTSKETAKPPDPKAEQPPVPEPAPVTPPQATPAPPLLRTQATADVAAAERQIKESLARTDGILKNIHYQRLSEDRKRAYDDIKALMERADAAVKISNYELAKGLSSTAEKLAKELQPR